MPNEDRMLANKNLKPFIIGLLIVIGSVIAAVIIHQTAPEAKREAATKRTAMLVRVQTAEGGDFQPVIKSLGNVMPAYEVELRARVSGELVAIDPLFRPGERVNKGAVLAVLDDSDYTLALAERESELADAIAQLQIEQGEQVIAESDYRQLKRELPPMQEALVLRKPQLRSAEAGVDAARAEVQRAELDLERTRLKSPFDALVIDRFVSPGSQVSPGETVAHLVGTDRFWVEATVPLSKMPFLDTESEGNNVKIFDRSAWPKGAMREGRVLNTINMLDGASRLLKVLIEVEDPLGENASQKTLQPLVLNSYVEAEIQGKTLENVVQLERQYLRKDDTTWVYVDGLLEIRDLNIVFMNQDYVYVSQGLKHGDQIVVSDLSRIREGAELRLEGTSQ